MLNHSSWTRRSFISASFTIALLAGTSADADVIFDTFPSWNGTDFISPFGFEATSTYGQTFVAPSGTMDDFTFYMGDPGLGPTGAPTVIQFEPQIYAWSGSLLGGGGGTATGPVLFSTGPLTLTGSAAGGGLTPVYVQEFINTADLPLTPGNQYVALFTTSFGVDFTSTTGTDLWGLASGSHLAGDGGGGMVYFNNGSNSGDINTVTWDNSFDFGDLAWTANFDTVAAPEPFTLSLFGAGLVGAVAFRRRKKKSA